MQQISNIQSFGSGNINSGNVTNSHNRIITVNKTNDEDNQIKQWLSPLEPRYRHQSVQTNRVAGVGGWILERNEFQEWCGSQGVAKQAVLFCYGHPGVGKTHMSSLVIDSLCDQARDRDIAVAGLYCDHLAQEQQSATNMLGAILKQLLERDGIPQPVRQAFRVEKRGFGGRAVQVSDLVKILKTTIASLPEVVICIDGLDECLPNNRREFLESLQNIMRASPTIRMFLSGRPHIRDEIMGYFAEATMIEVIPTIGDIRRYLEMRLDRDTTPSAMDDNIRARIMSVIPRKISKIFLLVSLNIDAVLEEVTISQRKKKLDQMIKGNGLRDAYLATLARIKTQKGTKARLGMEVLMWLSHAERPLTANELCYALGVELGSTRLDSQNIPAIETLLGCSLGLVTVEESSYTVRLVHYTLQEFLSNNTNLFPSPHSKIAQTCLTYLNFQLIRDLSPMLDYCPPETPLLEYASCYWGVHARRELTRGVNTLALRLLDGFDRHVSCKILLSLTSYNFPRPNRRSEHPRSGPRQFTGLHGAAYLGIAEMVVGLLEMKKWDLGATDARGNTAISLAASRGHEATVKVFLEQDDIAPNIPDDDGNTPLLLAVEVGHKGVVKMLLEREDITPNTADRSGRTPLSWAGDEEIVKMLLEREDITPNTADKGGRTPLSWAAWAGNRYVVKMLLEREDATPNATDKGGRTPLSWAAQANDEYVVKMLLKRGDVSPNTADQNGETPLSWAAKLGKFRVTKALLECQDVTPSTADKGGRTPLSWAAGNGYGDIVELLLVRKDVAPDTPDNEGRTPYSRAAERGHIEVMRMLQERSSVSEDIMMTNHTD